MQLRTRKRSGFGWPLQPFVQRDFQDSTRWNARLSGRGRRSQQSMPKIQTCLSYALHVLPEVKDLHGFAEYIGCTMVHQEWRDDERIKLIFCQVSAGKISSFHPFLRKKTKSPCSRGEIFYGKIIGIKT